MTRRNKKNLLLIASLSFTAIVLSACASRGYNYTCDWCDEASQVQLRKDVAECNAVALDLFPYQSSTRKTGRIITSHGSTSCTTNKRGDTTCSTGSSYTYPEKETVDVTNYAARRAAFDNCISPKAQSYRAKVVPTKALSGQSSSPDNDNYNWDLKTPPKNVDFAWTTGAGGTSNGKTVYFSTSRNSIQVNGGRRLFWALYDHESNEGPKFRSLMMQLELDCLVHKMRPLVGYAFPEPMGRGELIAKISISSDSPEGAWQSVSQSDPHLSQICAAT